MKDEMLPYGKIWDITSSDNPDISLNELSLYGYLCFMSGSSGSCYPSQRRIASNIHASCEVVHDATKHLIEAGYVSIKMKRIQGRSQWFYKYTLHIPADISKTYGYVTTRTMKRCINISRGAMGLWMFFLSYSGESGQVYFNRKCLAERLNISEATLRKYIRELEAAAEISTFRESVQGSLMTRFIIRPSREVKIIKAPKKIERLTDIVVKHTAR